MPRVRDLYLLEPGLRLQNLAVVLAALLLEDRDHCPALLFHDVAIPRLALAPREGGRDCDDGRVRGDAGLMSGGDGCVSGDDGRDGRSGGSLSSQC